ncbi:hypothetical protein Ahy_B01g053139 [Arachis hypogaea]|uniref:Uncharacterized protein n=1 Tax=Arachis hypogaea TaxID=3818 RepID=A0A445AR59_ARAHY|nr:hypothetical protein Ahy_B01g053139 [Arachis hypogaea]
MITWDYGKHLSASCCIEKRKVGVYLHDPTAFLAAVDPTLVTWLEGSVRYQTSGITRETQCTSAPFLSEIERKRQSSSTHPFTQPRCPQHCSHANHRSHLNFGENVILFRTDHYK